MSLTSRGRRPALVALALCASSLAPPAYGGAKALVGPREFRDLFAGFLAGTHGPAAIHKLIFQPGDALKVAPVGARSPEDFLARVAARVQAVTPTRLYREGLEVPLSPASRPRLLDLLRRKGASPSERLTFVVVPGVFGEFVEARAFEDIFSRRTSAFRSAFLRALDDAKRSKDPARRDLTNDATFSLDALAPVRAPLEELVSVGSLDDVDGSPLVRVVLFNTKLFSLESAGDVSDKATLFTRRLEKLFALVGTPTNLAFVGHSRGTIIGLDMLAQARLHPERHPWLRKVRAFVSLSGVVYGSDLADNALNTKGLEPVPRVASRVAALRRLGDDLRELPQGAGLLARLSVVKDNVFACGRFVGAIAKTLFSKSGELGDFGRALETLKKVAAGLRVVDLESPWRLIKTFFTGALHIDRAGAEYNLNIRRAKLFVAALLQAVEGLSTRARLAWWRSHVVPTRGLRYYAFASTMAEARPGDPTSGVLASSVYSYNPRLLDYALLLAGYHSYATISGARINDSQVAAHRVRFWPQASALFNPAQPPLRASFLGVANVDHWGIVLPVVLPSPQHDQASPFPRTQMLQAFAAAILLDQDRAAGRAPRLR